MIKKIYNFIRRLLGWRMLPKHSYTIVIDTAALERPDETHHYIIVDNNVDEIIRDNGDGTYTRGETRNV